MKQASFLQNRQASFLTVGLLIAAVFIGLAGTHHLGDSSAATATYNHSPLGGVDYCKFVSGKTVLYGWAHDPDAPAGVQPYVDIKVGATAYNTIPTNVSGYRDAPINSYIKSHDPGAPTSTTYGWQLQIANLYKGNFYAVSGTALNYGTGSNVAIPVNSAAPADGVAANIAFTASKTIPDACLATKPAPAPLPTPTPIPTPTPTPTPAPVKTAPKTTVKTTTPAATATPSAAADGTVTAGTTSVTIKVPVGNATTIHLSYGSDADGIDQATPDQNTNNTDTTVVLTSLSAKTTYHYQITRLVNGQTATSPAAEFTTSGYDISLALTSHDKPVGGIAGQLNDAKATSDKDGKLTFKNLDSGTYSVRFTYKGHTYSQSVSTDTTVASDDPAVLAVEQTVNLDDLQLTASTGHGLVGQKHSSGAPVIVIVIVGIVLLAGGIWFFLRRRRRSADSLPYAAVPAAPVIPVNPAVSGDILDQHSHRLSKKHPPAPEPLPEHAGKSLREMVVESMHAEAARRKEQGPPSDPK